MSRRSDKGSQKADPALLPKRRRNLESRPEEPISGRSDPDDSTILKIENRASANMRLRPLAEAMQATAAAKGYEKNAWILMAIVSIFGLFISIVLVAGIQLDVSFPAFVTDQVYLARVAGMSILGFALAGLAISYTAFKRGEKWSWYLFWYVPLYLLYSTADNYSQGGGNWPLYAVLMLAALASLLLPYRLFFPKK